MGTTTADRIRQQQIDALFEDRPPSELAPLEIARELEQRDAQPTTISALSVRDVDAARKAHAALVDASIKATHPEDWVVFKAKDGPELGFLQDVGCQRVRSIWGISFEPMDLIREVVEEDLGDGNVQYLASASGYCAITGERGQELGARSSGGFFEKQWTASADRPVERAKLKVDIRKAALANARGRLVRTFTGLHQVPVARLVAAGFARERLRGTDFQSGTKGGSGAGAGPSDPQLKMIAAQSLKQKKVAGLENLKLSFDDLVAKLREGQLTGGRDGTASQFIEQLQKAKPAGITIEAFEAATGVTLVEESGE